MADRDLESVFLELISQASLCVGGRDPIQESIDELIEGIRVFSEKYDTETFINELIHCQDSKQSLSTMMDKYRDKNEKVKRARTFILACFDEGDSQEKREHTIRCFLQIIRQCDELRLKRVMEPDRYAV